MFDRGLYDESLRICSDWTFFMDRIIIEGATTRHLPVVTSIFDTTGISADPRMRHITESERNAYIRSHFPRAVLDLVDEYNRREQVLDTMVEAPHRGAALITLGAAQGAPVHQGADAHRPHTT